MATSTSYVKKVLVDEAEMDRLQQRQLRESSPELASLSRLKSDMDSILRRSNLTPQEKLTRLAAVQGRFEKIRQDAGVVFSSAAAAIASSPQMAAPPPSTDADDESEEDEKQEATKHESKVEDKHDPLLPTSKKIRHFGDKGQYERKARNVMLKIDKYPEIIKANREGELVVNGQAVPDSNFALLFRSVFSKTHDLEKPGINQFLGALQQIGVYCKELSGRAVQAVYGSLLPPRVDAAARLAEFRGRVRAGVGDDDGDHQGDEDGDRFVTPVAQRQRPLAAAAAFLAHAAKSSQYKSLMAIAADATAAKKASAASSSSSGSSPAAASSSSKKKQDGKGGVQPPGKRPNILYVY